MTDSLFDQAVPQIAHFFVGGYVVLIFVLKGWGFLSLPPAASGAVSVLLFAIVKEYLDRQGWWEKKQGTKGNLVDFLFYLSGVVVTLFLL